MKNSTRFLWLFGLVAMFLPISAFSQNIPNGGFEDVHIDTLYPSESHPINWMPFHWLMNIECFPFLEQQGELTADSYNGQYAIKMETQGCDAVGNGWQHRASGFYTGTPGAWPPEEWSVVYGDRPDNLNFYYKFQREGNDSAFVEVMLFNYDSITPGIPYSQRTDTVGYGLGFIYEEADEYTLYQLPIVYFMDSFPSFIKVTFGSGRRCTLANCTEGTTLWVDDVLVSGGTVGVEGVDADKPRITLYPNPATGRFSIQLHSRQEIEKVSMRDYLGREVKSWNGLREEFWVEELPAGTYFIRIETGEGAVVKKLVVM